MQKTGQKLSSLTRKKYYLTPDQKILLKDSVKKSHFRYCPLIWMFTSLYLNNALSSTYKRASLLIYNDHELPFYKSLAIKICKF